MADFNQAYERMVKNEGGYQLTNIPGDLGGMTYAGISRRYNPDWPGWAILDAGQTPPAALVRSFYRAKYWAYDGIAHQSVAENLFDFGVNADPKVALKLAQLVVGVTPDGVCGPKTITALNACDETLFIARYALAKIARYRDICTKNSSQMKFLLGWINRTLREAA